MTKNESRNTSIYWASEETGRRARWMAEAEGDSVSAFVSRLVNDRWAECNPEPPIEGLECPTCQEVTDFFFMAYWEDLGPGTKLYTCSACGTTKTLATIKKWNDGEQPMKEKMEATHDV